MRLLIAEYSGVYAKVLAQRVGKDVQVQVCCDGLEALELLHSFHPDALIINLQLPMKDGLSVLRQSVFTPPVILATTSYISDHILRLAYALGVSQMLVMPGVSCLLGTLQELLLVRKQKIYVPDLREQTRMHLINLNFQTHLIGCRELAVAIPMYAADPGQKLAAELYPAVAEVMDISDGRAVEHAIRNAIANAWKRRDVQVWEKYFPGMGTCPNNKRFMAKIVALMEK